MEHRMDTWIFTDLGEMKWSVKDFSRYHVATSPYGGFIALIPCNDNEDRDFSIYDGSGTLLVEDVLSPSYHVVAAHWLEDQRLCIFLDDCRILIYTPSNEPRRMMEILTEEEIAAGVKVKNALVSGLVCCLLTTTNDIYFSTDITATLAKKASNLPEDVKWVCSHPSIVGKPRSCRSEFSQGRVFPLATRAHCCLSKPVPSEESSLWSTTAVIARVCWS